MSAAFAVSKVVLDGLLRWRLRQVRPTGVDGPASALQPCIVCLDDDLPVLPQEAVVVVELRVLNVLPVHEPPPLCRLTAAES